MLPSENVANLKKCDITNNPVSDEPNVNPVEVLTKLLSPSFSMGNVTYRAVPLPRLSIKTTALVLKEIMVGGPMCVTFIQETNAV
tara:strand:- start:163 stop:417 length:255 start_codon:yes stop_codon:yes gene_type:complete